MLLEYLQEPPGKFSPNTIERQFNKVVRLRDLGAARHLVAAYASSAAAAKNENTRRSRSGLVSPAGMRSGELMRLRSAPAGHGQVCRLARRQLKTVGYA